MSADGCVAAATPGMGDAWWPSPELSVLLCCCVPSARLEGGGASEVVLVGWVWASRANSMRGGAGQATFSGVPAGVGSHLSSTRD